jgi:hypothetical protein
MAIEFQSKKRILICKQKLKSTPEKIFPLLCPKREYEWIETWSCNIVFSETGFAELDCVFITEFPDDVKETWVIDRYIPNSLIQFVRFSESRIIRFLIELQGNNDGTTSAIWTQYIVSLNEKGNSYIENLSQQGFETEIKTLENMLNHYLRTNTMLSLNSVQDV